MAKRRAVTISGGSAAAQAMAVAAVRDGWLREDMAARDKRLQRDMRALEASLTKQIGRAFAKARGGDIEKHAAALTRTLIQKTDAAIRSFEAQMIRRENDAARRANLNGERDNAARAARDEAERARYKPTSDGLCIDGEFTVPWLAMEVAYNNLRPKAKSSVAEERTLRPTALAFEHTVTGMGTAVGGVDGLRVKTGAFEILLPWPVVYDAIHTEHCQRPRCSGYGIYDTPDPCRVVIGRPGERSGSAS